MLTLIPAKILRGQDFGHLLKAGKVKLGGSISLTSEFYSSSGIEPRKSPKVFRAIVSPTITFGKNVSIPLMIYFSSEKIENQQPFNQLGASPKISGWLTLHAGNYSSKISDLTFGDNSLLGTGVEAEGKKFRVSILFGQMRKALEPDTAKKFFGVFRRTAWAFSAGYGNREVAYINLNLMRAYENKNSISYVPAGIAPMENAVGSLSFGMTLLRSKMKVSGEAALSAFTNDTRVEEKDNVKSGIFKAIFTPRYSSQIDGAVKINVNYILYKHHTIDVESKWIGLGFVTLGYEQLQNDVFEISASDASSFLDRKLYFRGTLGIRFNNIRGNRFATTNRYLVSVSSAWQPSDKFGIHAQYFNYNMNSKPKNDTLRIDNLFQSISITPHFNFKAIEGYNNVSVSYMFQSFKDNNIVYSNFNNSRIHNMRGFWTISYPSTLSFSTSAGYISSKIGNIKTDITSLNESVGYSFFKGKVFTALNIMYTVTRGPQGGKQLNGGLNAVYSLNNWGQLNLYLFLSRRGGIKESQATLQYNYVF